MRPNEMPWRVSLSLNDSRNRLIDPTYFKKERTSGILPKILDTPFGNFNQAYHATTTHGSAKPIQKMLGSVSHNKDTIKKASELEFSKEIKTSTNTKNFTDSKLTSKSKIDQPQTKSNDTSACSKRSINASELHRLYDYGGLPVCVNHNKSIPTIEWKVPISKLDLTYYLPIFVDGLREKQHPYRLFAVQGTYDLLDYGGDMLEDLIPKLIPPLHKAVNTRDPEVICIVLKVIQKMLSRDPTLAVRMIPYLRKILPSFNVMWGREPSIGDHIDYKQHLRLNMSELIRETLLMLDKLGGEIAYYEIKHYVPLYENYTRV